MFMYLNVSPKLFLHFAFFLGLRKLLLKCSESKYTDITLPGIQFLRKIHSFCIGQDEEDDDFKQVGVREIKLKVSSDFPLP